MKRLAAVFAVCTACAFAGTPLDDGYRQMYNLQFTDAHRSFREWQAMHPDDPMGPVSEAAAYLFAELDRLQILQSEFFTDDNTFKKPKKLDPDPALRRNFEGELARTKELADRILARAPQDENATFASILRLGLQSDYTGLIEKRYLASISAMKAGRTLAESLLARDPKLYDAYVAVGVENYILSLKPAPVRWLLRLSGARTDKEEGLTKLRMAAQGGHYLKPFARLLLAVAALRQKNLPGARDLLAALAAEFPKNTLYQRELVRLQQAGSRNGE